MYFIILGQVENTSRKTLDPLAGGPLTNAAKNEHKAALPQGLAKIYLSPPLFVISLLFATRN